MRLINAIPVGPESRLVFVGAGGKSTSMFRLARQVLADGFARVIVTASTHLAISQINWADHHFVVSEVEDFKGIDLANYSGLILITGPTRHDYRTEGLPFSTLAALDQLASQLESALLVEGDGSRRLPLKAPAAHEPAIPPWAHGVVVCAGLSGLGEPLAEGYVHRPEIFSALSGIKVGEQVTVDGLAAVLGAAKGGLKNIPPDAIRYALVTQVDSPELAGQAKQLGDLILPNYNAVIATDLKSECDEVKAIYRQVAGVVLAAGGSERLRRPKQLLDWQGQPFVRVCAETALAAGLAPVIVVTGAYQSEVVKALHGLAVKIVHNPDWGEGQGTSVRTAARYLSGLERVSAAVFSLVDQPQIPVRLIETLLEAYSAQNYPLVVPLIDQRRGNPVLFDRVVFPDLLKLSGDSGGRQVYSKFTKLMVPWYDRRDGLDVDTEEDYRNLTDSF
ncbi:MAG: putative selenium-dependent hydroxylase accessory protein YqeC [Anaerolineales bacterium]|nr:putative selenium-dependent hydroxylase accessory protein YqeC [Anaerolineales bacterium]